jgi:hypothetical protein
MQVNISSRARIATPAYVREVFSESINNLLPPAILDIPAEFLKSDVNDVVVMKFFGRDFIA